VKGIVRFTLLHLSRELKRYFGVIFLSVLLLFFLSSILFISVSIEKMLLSAIDAEPDFVVQKLKGERVVPIDKNIGDELIEIAGTTKTSPRVYGRYFVQNSNKSFFIIGIDFLDEQSHKALEEIVKEIDLNKFLLNRKNILIGEGVKKWLDANEYHDNLKLFTPKGKAVNFKIFSTLPEKSNLISYDMILMDIKSAKKILGLKRSEVTDFTFNVPNELEWEIIPIKVASLDYDLRVISKKESKKAYEEMFDFKNGLFLLLFLMVLLAFLIILYQRYSQIGGLERETIGALRAIGWSMQDVLLFKFLEAVFVIAISYLLGVTLAYFYVFYFDAPILRQIFIAPDNLGIELTFIPQIDFFILVSIFLFYALPFMASILIPVWKVAVKSPKEVLR